MMFFSVTLLILFSFMKFQSEGLKLVGPDAPLVAVAGEDLVLPCFIKPQTSAMDMTVEWIRVEDVASVVHLYRDHEDRNEKQAQSYRGRTSLFKEELQKGNASLKLSSLRVSDEGKYRCLVEDKSSYDDITVHVTVEVILGSHPVITMESYDHSGGINLVCESRGWNPAPEVLWMNREGDTLPAGDTQIHRDTEGFSVIHRITVYDYSDSNKFYCRLQQQHHMMEAEVIINSKVFDAWKWVGGISVLACLIAVGWIVTAVICYKKVLQSQKQKAERQRQRLEYEVQSQKQTAELQRQRVEDELQSQKQKAASELQKEKEYAASELQKEKRYAELQRQRVEYELIKKKKFAVDVTLDPDTAHPDLILFADGKQVRHGDTKQNLPDTPKRFNKCVCVLGKQSFSSGRFYYEVQVRGKTEWNVGVAKKSINRKGDITLTPQNGFWTVKLRNENQYEACSGPSVRLTLRAKVEKVGVFVDYEEGLVSFYDVKSSSHIYSFTAQSFTEKLYPYFSPCLNEGGKNSAPLIISPVINTE
ncbi:butyrophilin subfamily 2 member A2 isoform X2 [Ictalurus punctatus]|uniref:Butyrophilin subfamily 2 member A2 isoform X2 n=1 Tax=Ictalurus punctatus TaxID=7998 RepID=A0A2D0RDL5_ICTPU|nr:butyrophilin subfamily 2 member A2 isoform X2 [Ictalurus punctatus]